jgi:hypothetical protein
MVFLTDGSLFLVLEHHSQRAIHTIRWQSISPIETSHYNSPMLPIQMFPLDMIFSALLIFILKLLLRFYIGLLHGNSVKH